MGMVVRSNIMAVNSQRQLNMNNNQVSKALEKLSSGYRINRAGDDASGLAISEKMKAQIKGLDTASLNSQDGISLVQTAEGALTEVHNMLNRMTEIATRSANGINDDINRESLQKEVKELQTEIDRIAESTNFNGINLLDGSLGVGATVTMGTDGTANAAGDKTKTVLDFSKLEIEAGATVTLKVGNTSTTFEFVKAAGDVKAGNKAVVMGATKDDTLTALANAIKDNGVSGFGDAAKTATATGGKITIESDAPAQNTGKAFEAVSVAGTTGLGLKLQIGDTADSFNQLAVSVGDMSSKGIGVDKVDISTRKGAADAIDTLRSAIDKVSEQRATLGATQNRLEYTINNLDTASENLQAANSRIRDTDMAKMMMEYTKINVLTQSAQAMLAQANQQPQSVLQLLQ